MIKSRINNIALSFIFIFSPIIISFTSFFTYVYLGNKLDVATAFTALALFNMIQQPLNVISTFTVKLLQTAVSINRISAYLDEDEVSGQVSSLKRGNSVSRVMDDGQGDIGFENASFRWNERKNSKVKRPVWRRLYFRSSRFSSPSIMNETPTLADTPEQQDHRFQLRDLDLVFPQDFLTVITGPTGSGKTALLVGCLMLCTGDLEFLIQVCRWRYSER
jgi:ABC-type multidrug transport system fused ATPase/permease subunit